MKSAYIEVISEHMGCEPVKLNSALVSAQGRARLYWTNIPIAPLEDKGVTLSDILEEVVDGEGLYPAGIRGRRLNKDYDKTVPITQCLEVRKTNREKSNCLTTVEKDNVLTPLAPGRYPDAFKRKLPFRYYTLKEKCRLQTVVDDFFKVSSKTQANKMLGNGWTVDLIAHIFEGLKENR